MLRIPEEEEDGEGHHAKDEVDGGDVDLAAGPGRIAHLQMGHPVEAGRLGDHGVGAGDEGLGGDDAGGYG